MTSDFGQLGTIVGQRHKDAVGAGLDITKRPFDRGGGVGLLMKPIGVDPGVDEQLGLTSFDRSHFRGRQAGVDEFLVGTVFDVDPGDRQSCDVLGDGIGVVAVSVLDVDADVARQWRERGGQRDVGVTGGAAPSGRPTLDDTPKLVMPIAAKPSARYASADGTSQALGNTNGTPW